MKTEAQKKAKEAVEHLRHIINSFEESDFIDGDSEKCCNSEKLAAFNEASKVLIVAMENLQAERREKKD